MHRLVFLLFLLPSSLYALDHYCEDNTNIGRAEYACGSETAFRSVSEMFEDSVNQLEILNDRKKGLRCRKKCKKTKECKEKRKDRKEYRGCLHSCMDECFRNFASDAVEDVQAASQNFENVCDSAFNNNECNISEKRSVCKRRQFVGIRNILDKIQFVRFRARDLSRLLRNATRLLGLSDGRVSTLGSEIDLHSDFVKDDTNKRLECNLKAPENLRICDLELLYLPGVEDRSLEYISRNYARLYKQENAELLAQCDREPELPIDPLPPLAPLPQGTPSPSPSPTESPSLSLPEECEVFNTCKFPLPSNEVFQFEVVRDEQLFQPYCSEWSQESLNITRRCLPHLPICYYRIFDASNCARLCTCP